MTTAAPERKPKTNPDLPQDEGLVSRLNELNAYLKVLKKTTKTADKARLVEALPAMIEAIKAMLIGGATELAKGEARVASTVAANGALRDELLALKEAHKIVVRAREGDAVTLNERDLHIESLQRQLKSAGAYRDKDEQIISSASWRLGRARLALYSIANASVFRTLGYARLTEELAAAEAAANEWGR